MKRFCQWIAIVGTTIVTFVPWMKEQCPHMRVLQILQTNALSYDGTLFSAGGCLRVFHEETGRFHVELTDGAGNTAYTFSVGMGDALHQGLALKARMALRRHQLSAA